MEKNSSVEKNAIIATFLGHILWGFTPLATRLGQRYVLPTHLLAHRFTAAFLISALLLLFGKEKIHLRGKKLMPLIGLCLCELACFFFESYGIYYTNATTASVFFAASPIAAILLSALFLREYPTGGQVVFALVSIAGVVMITVGSSSLGVATLTGIFLLLMYCFSSGAYKTVNRSASREFTPLERTFVLLGVCMVAFNAVTLFQLGGDLAAYVEPLTHPTYVVLILCLSIFASVAANMLINFASRYISVTKMATFGAITTICATFSGIVFLHEPFSIAVAAGAVLILLGVWQVTVRGK